MKGKYALLAVVSCVSVLVSGCSLVRAALGTESREQPPCVSPAFDLSDTSEAPGPAEPFNAEARRAASASESTTLDVLAAIAGWHGNWDRMIRIPDYATIDMLNAWVGTTSICWKGISNHLISTEGTSEGEYLFLDGTKPVQVVRHTGPEKLFFIKKNPPVVDRYAVLVPNGLYLVLSE